MKKCICNIIFCLYFVFSLSAQVETMPVKDNVIAQKYPFIRTVLNRISNNSSLDSFYQKLSNLKTTNSGTVSIVHIGDSHIQADFLSDVARDGLQEFFGNAGRGLVFPYQLAKSNAPEDINSSSNIQWQFNRIAHPEISIPYGISGYGITTNNTTANISLSLKAGTIGLSSFDRLKFFLDSNIAISWMLKTNNNDSSYFLKKDQSDSLPYRQVHLEKPAYGFLLSSIPSSNAKEFYGVSLENSAPGVIYHTIGVNGARYDQYNIASLFWQQLPALKADLYIVSLGTNESQATSFDEAAFTKELTAFIQKIKQTSPDASILITTAPDSYKKKRFNTVLRKLNTSIANYCNKNSIPLWDLYRITNGYSSAYSWSRKGLMSRDKIHFTAAGYRIQGDLLLAALAKGYNSFAGSH